MRYESLTELRKFVSPEIILGVDARLHIGRYLCHFGSRKPMVVTDAEVSKQPWFLDVLMDISANTPAYVLFSNVTPNPKDHEVMAGAKLFVEQDCDLVVAVGGGSPMDCAKCISIVSANGGNILDFEGADKIALPGPPLICVPTTAGSSADVSQFAIIMDTGAKIKKAIVSKKAVPDLALIDPVPLLTMEPYLTACTAMDALTHATEAFVSNAQSALTDVHALEAVKLISGSLVCALQGSGNINVMYQMMLGSLHAGLAFSNASLGAVHAMAHALGGMFDLPHGMCNSILLEHVVDANFSASPERYGRIAQVMGIRTEGLSKEAIRHRLTGKIGELREQAGIKPCIFVEGFNEELLGKLVANALNDPCMVTNPRQLSAQEVKQLYGKIVRRNE